MKLSIFGSTGFIGKNFCSQFEGHIEIPRGDKIPKSDNILYFLLYRKFLLQYFQTS